jgi:hypothetical protein
VPESLHCACPAYIWGKIPAKTISICGIRFINEKVHHDFMEIRDAVEGKEHSYTDEGEVLACPACETAWLQKIGSPLHDEDWTTPPDNR